MAKSMSPLIGALFNSVTPPSEDKKRAVKPTRKRTTKGEKSTTEPAQQHGELASYKEPTPVERIREHAKSEKVHATREWVEGRISTTQHTAVHKRANHVLMNKDPKSFRGLTNEKAPPKKLRGW
jgi:hypothetical protein